MAAATRGPPDGAPPASGPEPAGGSPDDSIGGEQPASVEIQATVSSPCRLPGRHCQVVPMGFPLPVRPMRRAGASEGLVIIDARREVSFGMMPGHDAAIHEEDEGTHGVYWCCRRNHAESRCIDSRRESRYTRSVLVSPGSDT